MSPIVSRKPRLGRQAAQPPDKPATPLEVLREWLQAGRSAQMRFREAFEGEVVHFSPAAEAIARDGFLYGVRDLRILDNSMAYARSERTGFNFAFEALSQDAREFAKTSRGAVILRVQGLRVEHMGDHEEQVIFWGPDAGETLGVLVRPDIRSPWMGGVGEGTYAECAREILASASAAPRP